MRKCVPKRGRRGREIYRKTDREEKEGKRETTKEYVRERERKSVYI
jgi:hypothetical protein